mmetsp:Transcript_50461/g.57129  ORF Transcript_50461/g.57129 Transcript_50461/m.57129 type:complete len:537 (-) Transcript_50461:31-1641(-)
MSLRSCARFRLCHLYAGACNVTTSFSIIYPHYYRRSMAVYAVGEGFTGALRRENILKTIPGHFDEEVSEEGEQLSATSSSSDEGTSSDIDNNSKMPLNLFSSSSSSRPVLIYPNDDIQQATVGWGISAILDTQGALQIVGRPHDLVSLLRLNRMPGFLQRWVNRSHDTSATTPVGSMVSNLIGWATGTNDIPQQHEIWKIAEKYSLLDDWTKVSINNNDTGDARIKQIACGPGFLAMIGESGNLYTMGVNNRGQCGNGSISNNVWTPESVRGLTLTSLPIEAGNRVSQNMAEQDQPIIQVALGFQQGYALSKAGQVYSWGKANRGQLGRTVDADQDPWARSIKINDDNLRVVEIGAGFHHGALLTDDGKVFIWGKSMSRSDNDNAFDDDDEEINRTADLGDARTPQQVIGLTATNDNEAMKVQRISCGSHHTAILMEDGSVYAIGIASDEPVPILDPVELIPAGVLNLPIRQFEAHHDRTTVIDGQGMVYQAHLWKDEILRDYAYFTPSYVETLLDEGRTIKSIHRGWRHTIIVTN